jgi:hypothetical protein
MVKEVPLKWNDYSFFHSLFRDLICWYFCTCILVKFFFVVVVVF